MFCLTGMTGNVVVVVSNSNLGVNDQKGFLLSLYLKTGGRLFLFSMYSSGTILNSIANSC